MRSAARATTLEGMEQGRNRRNREALLEAGRSIGHAFSARELHAAARTDQPRIGLTTAYRAIDRWRDEGLVEDAGTRGGEAVFVMCANDGHPAAARRLPGRPRRSQGHAAGGQHGDERDVSEQRLRHLGSLTEMKTDVNSTS